MPENKEELKDSKLKKSRPREKERSRAFTTDPNNKEVGLSSRRRPSNSDIVTGRYINCSGATSHCNKLTVYCRNKYRDAMLVMLEDKEDSHVLGTMAFLYALIRYAHLICLTSLDLCVFISYAGFCSTSWSNRNPSIDRSILQAANLLPLRTSKAKTLLDELTLSPRHPSCLPFDSPEKNKVKSP